MVITTVVSPRRKHSDEVEMVRTAVQEDRPKAIAKTVASADTAATIAFLMLADMAKAI